MDSDSILMTSFNFNFLFKDCISKYSRIGSEGFNMWILGEHNSAYNSMVKWSPISLREQANVFSLAGKTVSGLAILSPVSP